MRFQTHKPKIKSDCSNFLMENKSRNCGERVPMHIEKSYIVFVANHDGWKETLVQIIYGGLALSFLRVIMLDSWNMTNRSMER